MWGAKGWSAQQGSNLSFRRSMLPFVFIFTYLFIYFGCAGSSQLRGLSLVAGCRFLLLLRSTGSRRHGLSSCDSRAQRLQLTGSLALRYMKSPQTGDQTMSPASAGRFLTTGPPGKSSTLILSSQLMNPRTLCS